MEDIENISNGWGISIRRTIAVIITVVGCTIAVITYVFNLKSQIQDCVKQNETLKMQIEAGRNDREAIKTINNTQNERLTRIETIIDMTTKTSTK